MNINHIDIGFTTVKKVIHFSDCHIRLTKRHNEYREIFDKFYAEIEKTPKETVILNLGDTVNSKLDLSPECIDLTSELLKNLADLRPTLVILGNHDLNLSNSSRLDSISPLVKALNHKNLFYLKDSGIYKAGDCLFSVMSVLDEPETYIRAEDIPNRYKDTCNHIIALHHGTVDNIKTNLGFTILNPRMTLDKFDKYDMVMLGDIHVHCKIQDLNKKENKPIIVYNGSTIAQDHSEFGDGHGFCLWDMPTRSYDFIKLPNDYGFFTAEIRDGKLVTDLKDCPTKAKLRLRCFNSGVTEVKEVVVNIKKTFELSEVSYIRCEDEDTKKLSKTLNENRLQELNVSNVDFQNELITQFLKNKHGSELITEEIIESIKGISKEINDVIPKEESIRNVEWKLKSMEFDNMFCYGEGNKLDFTKLKDVIGLFSKNASGKSSLLSILCFVLFDKTERAFKGHDILNKQKMNFKCIVNFEINGVDYWIERVGKRDKKGSVKVTVNFWKMEADQKVILNDEQRRGTDSVIRDYIGTFEDFSLTSLALQGKDSAFINLGQSEKKDLFARFMGINIFDSLFDAATDKSKETAIILKKFNQEDFTEDVATLENKISELTSYDLRYTSDHEILLKNRQVVESDLLTESKKLINLNNVPTDIEGLLKSKNTCEKNIKNSELEFKNVEVKLKGLLESGKELKSKITVFESDNIKDKKSQYDILVKEGVMVKHKYDLAQNRIQQQTKKIETLSKHKYDPNCKFCIDNEFVRDANKSKKDLEDEKPSVEKIIKDLKECNDKIKSLEGIVQIYKTYEDCLDSFTDLRGLVNTENQNKLNYQSTINDQTNKLTKIKHDIDLYQQSKDSIEKNKQTESSITVFKSKLVSIDSSIKESNRTIRDNNSDLVSQKDQLQKIKNTIEEMKLLEEKYRSFEYYLEAINRDGIPSELISQSLPSIENEVNNILSQIVEFTMELKTDGKNIITNIVYDEKKWPLELCSGMEKFCSALALRVALMNVCSIPKSNFLSIDEGFACCDAEHISMAHSLLSFLKISFDFVLIISHADVMRDMVDSYLEIKLDDSFSKINNT